MKIFDLTYFISLIILSIIFCALYLYLKNKDKEFQYKFLLIWCFINFALHFLKQLFYWNTEMFVKSTAENICAVSTMTFPFIMLIKKKDSYLKDFMYFIGLLGGIAAMVYPTEALGEKVLRFETFRFYFCHFSLFAIPMFLAIFGIARPKLKSVIFIPLFFLIVEGIIFLNTAALCFTGLSEREGFTPFELFISSEYMNGSFTFGPTSDMGGAGRFVGSLCPSFMKVDIFNINGGATTYWPVIWLLIPSYVIFTPIYLLFGLPFFIKNKKIIK